MIMFNHKIIFEKLNFILLVENGTYIIIQNIDIKKVNLILFKYEK